MDESTGGGGRSPGSEVGLGLSLAVLPRAGRVSPLPSASSSVLGKHELTRAHSLKVLKHKANGKRYYSNDRYGESLSGTYARLG